MSTYPPFERRYFLDEVLRLRTLFGTQAFWALSEERRKQVTGGLLYVYLHTAEINESDTALFQATIEEYQRRELFSVQRLKPEADLDDRLSVRQSTND